MTIQRFLLIVLILIIIIFGGSVLYLRTSKNTNKTVESAQAFCDPETKKINIAVSFTNNDTKEFNVNVRDNQTNTPLGLGSIMPHKQKTDTLNTNATSLKAGTVAFSMTEVNNFIPTQKTVNYAGITTCAGFAQIKNQTGSKNLPATGTPIGTWFFLGALLSSGLFIQKFAKKNN
jgi:hypothetical protein